VSYTFEAGLRGQFNIAQGQANWTVGGFRALNTNNILPISSPLVGHEFFQNAGNTLRQGIEANLNYKQDRWNIYANYSYVDATFQNALTLQSPFNPFAEAISLWFPAITYPASRTSVSSSAANTR
jgi:iron complex outermembrane receptor protein